MALAYYLAEQLPFLRGGLSRGQVVGRDFINYWTGSRLLLDHQIVDIFDPHAYARALTRLWGAGLGEHSFSYPPSIFPLIAWTGALPYGVAFILWSVGGIAALLAAAWPYSRRWPLVAVIVLSPAVLVCLDTGQNGLLTAALLIGGLRLVDCRPWLAGALIGLVTFKPQLGILIPLALIASGRWKVAGGATASALALAVGGFLLTGDEGWRLYASRTVPFQGFLFEHSRGMWQAMTPSPLVAVQAARLSQKIGYAVQIACTTVCAVLTFVHFRRLGAEGRRIGSLDILVLVAAGFIAAPYSFNYDMPSLSLALMLACVEHPELDARRIWRVGVLALWMSPILVMSGGVIAMITGGPWLPLGTILMGLGVALVWLTSWGSPQERRFETA